jgi:transposase
VTTKPIDKEFTKLLSNQLLNARGFYDYGVKRGLTTPEAFRLTIARRQDVAKALVNGGMSKREAAKQLGVSHSTVVQDVNGGRNSSKSGKKSSTRNGKSTTAIEQKMPTEQEADESWQNDIYDQACLLLNRMADETRAKFIAHIRRKFSW